MGARNSVDIINWQRNQQRQRQTDCIHELHSHSHSFIHYTMRSVRSKPDDLIRLHCTRQSERVHECVFCFVHALHTMMYAVWPATLL